HQRRIPPAPPGRVEPQSAELRRQAELEQDLQLARDLQQGLLLEAVPRLPGWEISAVSLPARDLGGDLYDFLKFGDGLQGIMIGDVSGKGLPAALRMAVARTVFRHETPRNTPPATTLAPVNRAVISEIPQGMITMLYAVLEPRLGRLHFANAGHLYPVLINGQVSELELSGLPLGVDDESDYGEASTILHPGDTVLLYTDGIIEAANAADEIYGYERLEHLLATTSPKPRALVAALLAELRSWSLAAQTDDITMVVVRRRLTDVGAELRSVADDVLGAERAAELWQVLPLPAASAPADTWRQHLAALISAAQSRFGRGLARELNGQLRLALEEYRS
ncbi:MAG TPA: PP2C family protein-serine/threonine phosphatase, partial [Roseiflexaceae bacterium]|nr:PP2C family protein-serine/threonine phosphatase [Roseiflexaceae bacterium]